MISAWDVVGAALLLIGSGLTFISAIGMFRFPDLMTRLHVATKPQVLSLILSLLGAACLVRDTSMTWTLILVCLFQLVTSPISAHMLSRTGYRTGTIDTEGMLVDELREDLVFNERAGKALHGNIDHGGL